VREFCRGVVEAWENSLKIIASQVIAYDFAEHGAEVGKQRCATSK